MTTEELKAMIEASGGDVLISSSPVGGCFLHVNGEGYGITWEQVEELRQWRYIPRLIAD